MQIAHSFFSVGILLFISDLLLLLQDPAHRDSEPDLVFEDMTVMSDFELHCLCREERVIT